MSDKKGSYKIFENSEEEFDLRPCTFGLYEKMKIAQLRCTAIPEKTIEPGVTSKRAIIAEFKLSEEEIGEKDEYGIKELYEIIIKSIFMPTPKDIKMDDVNVGEVARANRDFFSQASGN